jgi:predicted Zn-dependent peptidase
MDYKISKLSNGMKVIMNRNTHNKTATIAIMINAGSNWETKELNGIAHFLEHLFFKGTKKRPSQLILSQELDHYGAVTNAFTDNEMTCYHAKVSSDHIDTVIEIMSDVLTNSLYNQEDINKEKPVVINEINQRSSIPGVKICKFFNEKFFKSLPIAKSIIGTEDNIKNIKREDLFAFLYQYYKPENIVISVAGNFKSYEHLRALLNKHFSKEYHKKFKLSSSHVFNKSKTELENYYTEWNNALELVNVVNSNQVISYNLHANKEDYDHSYVMIGFPGYKYRDDDNLYKTGFLSMILGDGMSSRLFQTIRTKYGLVYSIGAYHQAYDFTGAFIISYSCNHNKETQIKILKLIKKELDLLKNELISEKEYQNTLDMVQNQVKMNQEGSYGNCIYYGEQLLKDEKKNIKNYQESVNEYKKIKITDLKDHANTLLDYSKIVITTLSPFKIEEGVYKSIFT